MVIGSHHCVPTYLKPSSALDAPIKTDCLMLSWAQTELHCFCSKKKKKKKLNKGPKRLLVLCSESDSALLMSRFAFVYLFSRTFTRFAPKLCHAWLGNQQSQMYKSVIKRTIAITQGKKQTKKTDFYQNRLLDSVHMH